MSIIDEIDGTKLKLFNGKILDLLEIFYIDPESLSESFTRQASLYAYFGTLQAEAERQLAISKFDLEQAQAISDDYWRHYKDRREEKYTEAVIKSLVTRDSECIAKQNKKIQLDYEVNLLDAMTKALAQRASMLMSLGAMTRQEISMTGMMLKEQDDSIPKELKVILDTAKKHKRQV